MFQDAADLRAFYISSLGRLAQRSLRRTVRLMWPDVRQQTLVAIGYATPLLRPFMADTPHIVGLMPATQGVVAWPRSEPARTALVDETQLPLADGSVDKILLMHALECAPKIDDMMAEIARVLKTHGRVLVVVPNRTGLWAQTDSTPFGHGSSYTAKQLKALLRRYYFIPEQESFALAFPPSSSLLWRTMATLLQHCGLNVGRAFAGVHVIECSKQLYMNAPIKTAAKARSAAPLRPVLDYPHHLPREKPLDPHGHQA